MRRDLECREVTKTWKSCRVEKQRVLSAVNRPIAAKEALQSRKGVSNPSGERAHRHPEQLHVGVPFEITDQFTSNYTLAVNPNCMARLRY